MRKNHVIAAAAATALFGTLSSAFAAYNVITTFVPPAGTVAATTYPWSNPAYWTNGIPASNALVSVNSVLDTTTNVSVALMSVDTNLTAYALSLTPTANIQINQANNAVLTVLSEDSVYDTATNKAPAIVSINGTSQTALRVPLQLGDASLAAGNHTAYFLHRGTAGTLQIGNTIGQAAGQVWGVTIGSTDNTITDYREVSFRGDGNGNNYLLNRQTYTGQVAVLDKANLRLQNNVQPYGAGLPNYLINGTISRSVNAGAVVLNAIDGTGQITQTGGGGNREIFVGANNGNGNFSGAINTSNTRIYKIGTGTQSLGSGTSTTATTAAATTPITSVQAQNWAIEGTLVAPNLASLGGSTAITTLDGGELRYTGAGETTTTRVFNLSFRGGTLSSSGSGALVINGGGTAVMTNTNIATAVGDARKDTTTTGQVVTNAYGLTGLSQFGNKINVTGQQTTPATLAGAVPVIDEVNRTIDLGTGNSVNVASGGNGAPVFTFTAVQAIDRTLTLGGTNTADNTLGVVLTDETTLGGKVGVAKTGAGTWVLNGANTYTGTTTVKAGRLKVTTAAQAPVLTNAGGADVQGGSLVLDYTGGSSPIAQVKSILTAGYAGGFATGQIRSTTRVAGSTLGYGDNGSAVTVRVTLAGDADLDGDVDFNDFLSLQSSFGTTGTRFDQGNFNYDNITDFNDFLALQGNFGQSVAGDTAVFTDAQFAQVMSITSANAVPEPASLALIGLGAAGLMGRRRRA